MSWNGSDQPKAGGGATVPSRSAKSPSAWHGAAAGVAVVAIVGVGLWFAMCGEKKPGEASTSEKVRTIKEAKPAAASTNAVSVAEKPKKKLKTYIDEKGVERYEGGLRVVKHWPKPPADAAGGTKPLFKHAAENQISALLKIKPGTTVLGLRYNSRAFEKSLRESLKSEIEILPDDSEAVRAEKEAVIEAKKTMAEALERGEDVTKILDDTRQELIRLQRYRDQMKNTAAEKLAKDGATDAEIDEYVDAMNAILTENGIKPIKQKELARNVIKYQKKAEKLKEQEAQKKATEGQKEKTK